MRLCDEIIGASGIQFGTSGARGLVEDFTAEACCAFTCAFISVMKESYKFNEVAIAIDRRPSSPLLAEYCASALKDLGLRAVFYGVVPTPALALAAFFDGVPAIMVTGSHIPFDRNGLKFYLPDGEITKQDELKIVNEKVECFGGRHVASLLPQPGARDKYISRYLDLFETEVFSGKKIGIYEHSSAGRELYRTLFQKLGATVISLGRSEGFVPIDTEAVSDLDKEKAKGWVQEHGLDALFSTDGDGDRPLLADEFGNWMRGDVLGLLCSIYLNIDEIAVPVNCCSAIEKSNCFSIIERTKIGSPYVISALNSMDSGGSRVAGFEANGGYILKSDVTFCDRKIRSLPTRDALLPAVVLLASCIDCSLSKLVESLPARYTASDRLQDVDADISLKFISAFHSDSEIFLEELGLNDMVLESVDELDGLRLIFSDQTIVHLRPSGNAPELRCYAEAESEEKARLLVSNVLNVIKLKL